MIRAELWELKVEMQVVENAFPDVHPDAPLGKEGSQGESPSISPLGEAEVLFGNFETALVETTETDLDAEFVLRRVQAGEQSHWASKYDVGWTD